MWTVDVIVIYINSYKLFSSPPAVITAGAFKWAYFYFKKDTEELLC